MNQREYNTPGIPTKFLIKILKMHQENEQIEHSQIENFRLSGFHTYLKVTVMCCEFKKWQSLRRKISIQDQVI